MLIKDSEVLLKQEEVLKFEEYQARLRGWVAEQLKGEEFAANWEMSPLNTERQTGKLMKPEELEVLLRPYLPSSCFFRFHPSNPTKKYIGQMVEGKECTVVVYENAPMPEHSYRATFEEDVWDGETTRIDRKDVAGEGPGPGMRRSVQVGREVFRGWRTVIIRLVDEGLLTPTQAEGLFGEAQREEWAFRMGKRAEKKVPW